MDDWFDWGGDSWDWGGDWGSDYSWDSPSYDWGSSYDWSSPSYDWGSSYDWNNMSFPTASDLGYSSYSYDPYSSYYDDYYSSYDPYSSYYDDYYSSYDPYSSYYDDYYSSYDPTGYYGGDYYTSGYDTSGQQPYTWSDIESYNPDGELVNVDTSEPGYWIQGSDGGWDYATASNNWGAEPSGYTYTAYAPEDGITYNSEGIPQIVIGGYGDGEYDSLGNQPNGGLTFSNNYAESNDLYYDDYGNYAPGESVSSLPDYQTWYDQAASQPTYDYSLGYGFGGSGGGYDTATGSYDQYGNQIAAWNPSSGQYEMANGQAYTGGMGGIFGSTGGGYDTAEGSYDQFGNKLASWNAVTGQYETPSGERFSIAPSPSGGTSGSNWLSNLFGGGAASTGGTRPGQANTGSMLGNMFGGGQQPTTGGTRPTTGGYPQQPGGYPQQPGGYPQQPGGQPTGGSTGGGILGGLGNLLGGGSSGGSSGGGTDWMSTLGMLGLGAAAGYFLPKLFGSDSSGSSSGVKVPAGYGPNNYSPVGSTVPALNVPNQNPGAVFGSGATAPSVGYSAPYASSANAGISAPMSVPSITPPSNTFVTPVSPYQVQLPSINGAQSVMGTAYPIF